MKNGHFFYLFLLWVMIFSGLASATSQEDLLADQAKEAERIGHELLNRQPPIQMHEMSQKEIQDMFLNLPKLPDKNKPFMSEYALKTLIIIMEDAPDSKLKIYQEISPSREWNSAVLEMSGTFTGSDSKGIVRFKQFAGKRYLIRMFITLHLTGDKIDHTYGFRDFTVPFIQNP